MGCGPSKENEDKNKIDFKFKEVTLVKFKDTFEKAAKILEEAENIRQGIEDSREAVLHGTDADWLKEIKFLEAVRVLFWSISAANEGEIENATPDVTKLSPYIDFDRTQLKVEHIEILDPLQNYLKTIDTAEIKLPEILKALPALATTAQEAIKTAQEEAKKAGLTLSQIPTEISAIVTNTNKIKKGVEKVKKLPIMLKTANDEKSEVIKNLPELVSKADEIGAKAFKDGVILPREIFHKFNEGAKKTKQEKHKYDHLHSHGHGHDHKEDKNIDDVKNEKEEKKTDQGDQNKNQEQPKKDIMEPIKNQDEPKVEDKQDRELENDQQQDNKDDLKDEVLQLDA